MSETPDRDGAPSGDGRFERAVNELLAQHDRAPDTNGPSPQNATEPRGNGDLDDEALDRSREVLSGVLGR